MNQIKKSIIYLLYLIYILNLYFLKKIIKEILFDLVFYKIYNIFIKIYNKILVNINNFIIILYCF